MLVGVIVGVGVGAQGFANTHAGQLSSEPLKNVTGVIDVSCGSTCCNTL